MTTSDPWDDWRKKRRDAGAPDFPGFPFPKDFEKQFEAEFARMAEFMNAFVEQAMTNTPLSKDPKPGEPFVYGFSMRLGPDGKPQFQEFGNTKPLAPVVGAAPEIQGAREPLTDVITGEREVTVTVELPGVNKEDVNLHVARDAITIRVDAGRKYYKQIALPQPVVPKTSEATFKNGILDVRVERESPPKETGHKVDIR
ncbi:MAG: archaeal heat shock protein Hsp20 [Thermoplasmatota archaeon]